MKRQPEKKDRTVTLNVAPEARAILKAMAAVERKTICQFVNQLAEDEYKRRTKTGLLKGVR